MNLFLLTDLKPHAESFGQSFGVLLWNIIVSVLQAIGWGVLGIYIHKTRVTYAPKFVADWLLPLTLALKTWCAISVVRYVIAMVVLWYPIYKIQNLVGIITDLAFLGAVGVLSAFYSRVPEFLMRVKRHQIDAQRFQLLSDVAVDAIIEIDTMSNIWYANKAAHQIFGYADKELLGRNITELMPAEFRERHMLGVEKYLKTGEGRIIGRQTPTMLTAMRSNGDKFPIELTLTTYAINDTVRFCAIIRDVTYRTRLENAVIASVTGPVLEK